MPLGAFRQSLNLANPVATIDYGTYQGFFRSSGSSTVAAYNTANTNLGSVTHGCGTVAAIRARRIPGTTSHIVGIFGATASKFYRYTSGSFTQLASMTAVGRHGDIAFDLTTNKIYMVATRSTTPFIQIYEADLSSSVTTSTLLSNPATLPAGAPQSVKFSPNGLALAVNHAVTPFMRVYTRSGTTFTSVTVPTISSGPDTGTGTVGLGWNADGTALAYAVGSAGNEQISITKWTDSAFTGSAVSTTGANAFYTAAFNPNPTYANILLISTSNTDAGTASYYNFASHSLVTTSTGNLNFVTEYAHWSPDGLKVFLQENGTIGRIYDLNTGYTTSSAIASLLTGLVTRSLVTRGFDWMYH